MSGHSKWANIKHKKEKTQAAAKEKKPKNEKPKKPKKPVYVFKLDELDNELLIDQIEAIPTAKRTREQLVKIKDFTPPY